MSQYVQFFIRTKEDKFVFLCEYSRSSMIYQVANDIGAVYEKVRELPARSLIQARNILEGYQRINESKIKQLQEDIIRIQGCNNSLQEKREAFEDTQDMIDEYKQDLDEINYAENFFCFLLDIAESQDLWFGIEVGANPTLESIL